MNAVQQFLVHLSENEGPWHGVPTQDRSAVAWLEFIITVAIVSVMVIHFL